MNIWVVQAMNSARSSNTGESQVVNRLPVGERKFLQSTWLKNLAPGNFSNAGVGLYLLMIYNDIVLYMIFF